MATTSQHLRRGLPRTPGGEPWPPGSETQLPETSAVSTETSSSTTPPDPTPDSADPGPAHSAQDQPEVPEAGMVPAAGVAPEAGAAGSSQEFPVQPAPVSWQTREPLRRGLPRVPGGEPWPPAEAPAPSPAEATSRQVIATGSTPLRSGLPRVPGGDPWPPDGFAPEQAVPPEVAAKPDPLPEPAPEQTPQSAPSPAPSPAAVPAAEPTPAPTTAPEPEPVSAPVQAPPAVEPVATEKPRGEPILLGSRSLGQWAKITLLILVGGVLAAGILVLAARGVTTLPGVPEFLQRYPGVYEIPDFAEDGLPVWARWAHYLNFFFLLLVIRTGLLVRTQQKPDAFYTPKRGGKKVSIYLWLHTTIDVLWVLNGLAFVVTMVATGHWRRIVPTSWEVFPNAASSLLQYMTLEWPAHEQGWVYYNSLQELMYFIVVFIAAPLAVITGVRMSEWWPKNADTLNRIYPAPLARALHFPVMLFFVLFVIAHVVMVFATGAQSNLNDMFYGAPEPSWTGFWIFAAGTVLAVAATLAARPLIIAPVASLFGKVSNR